MAPQDFGFFSHDLLIGNRFGGAITAFDVVSGKFLGNLLDADDAPIAIDGLFGTFTPVPAQLNTEDHG